MIALGGASAAPMPSSALLRREREGQGGKDGVNVGRISGGGGREKGNVRR